MTTAVDLSHLDPAEVDDLFARARDGADPDVLAAEVQRLRRAHLLATARTAPARKRPPAWAAESHPQFCATKDGCDGRHLSEVTEVDADTGQWLLVGAEMDHFGTSTVVVTVDDALDGSEIRLSLDGAVALAAQLIVKVQLARTQSAMVRPEQAVAA